jgi:hypothetical protein
MQSISQTLTAAALEGRDIWAEVKTGKSEILLFIPETTAADDFDESINDAYARTRIGYFKVIDDIHLVYTHYSRSIWSAVLILNKYFGEAYITLVAEGFTVRVNSLIGRNIRC